MLLMFMYETGFWLSHVANIYATFSVAIPHRRTKVDVGRTVPTDPKNFAPVIIALLRL